LIRFLCGKASYVSLFIFIRSSWGATFFCHLALMAYVVEVRGVHLVVLLSC
jgi:hypothetical protein